MINSILGEKERGGRGKEAVSSCAGFSELMVDLRCLRENVE